MVPFGSRNSRYELLARNAEVSKAHRPRLGATHRCQRQRRASLKIIAIHLVRVDEIQLRGSTRRLMISSRCSPDELIRYPSISTTSANGQFVTQSREPFSRN